MAFKTSDKKQLLINKVREERKKRQNVTGTDSPHVTIIQDIAEQGSSESNAAGNGQAKSANEQIDEDQSLISIERETVYRYEIIYFDSRRHRLLKILIIIIFFLTTFIDMNMLKFIEGFWANVKLLNDLLVAEIFEFFLQIVILLTTMLLLLIALLANVAIFVYLTLPRNIIFK